LLVQADDNDTYQVDYYNSGVWKPAWTILPPGGYGLTTSTVDLSTPIVASELRVTEIGGDGLYAVFQVEAFVPEAASTLPLLSAAMGGLLFFRRRYAQARR